MPEPQIKGNIGNGLVEFKDDFSQPTVTVEFGKLTKTHDTIGKKSITQVFGEKADQIRVEGVITNSQIEDAYKLKEKKDVKVRLEEWSGTAVVQDGLSIIPRREVWNGPDGKYWLYDITIELVEVTRTQASPQTSNDSDDDATDSSDSGETDSGETDSESESDDPSQQSELGSSIPDGPISGEISRSENDGFLTVTDAEEKIEEVVKSRVSNVLSVNVGSVSASRGGDSDVFTADNVTINQRRNGENNSETKTVNISIVE